MKNQHYQIPALVLALFLGLAPVVAVAQESPPEQISTAQPSELSTSAEDLGYGVGSVLSSLFYSPFKVTYAGLGLLTGGMGFVLSAGNVDVANSIIQPAVRGNYVVTPSHLRVEEALNPVAAPVGGGPRHLQQAAATR